MKKITTLLMVMAGWLFAVSASVADGIVPETATAAADLTDGTYVIKLKSKTNVGYLNHYASCTGGRKFHNTNTTVDGTDLSYFWALKKSDDGETFTLQNLSSGAYVPADAERNKNMTSSTEASNAANLKYETITSPTLEGAVILYQTNYNNEGNNLYIHCNDHKDNGSTGNLSYWDGNNVGDAATTVQFVFYKVETTTVTYNLKDESGNTLETKTVENVPVGSTAVAPTFGNTTYANYNVSYYYTLTVTASDKTVTESNNTFDVQPVKGTAPFTAGAAYTVKFQANDADCLAYISGDNMTAGLTLDTWAKYSHGLWQFVESGYGVKIYNIAEKKYLQVASGDNQTKAVFTDDESAATAFVVRQNNSAGTFSIQYPGTASAFLGDHVNSNLGLWNPGSANASNALNGGRSKWTITAVDLETAQAFANARIEEVSTDAYNADGLLQLAHTADQKSAFKQSVTDAADLSALVAVDFPEGVFTPEAGAYYQIYNNREGNSYISSATIRVTTAGELNTDFDSENNRRILRNTATDALVPQLWQFETSDDAGYYYVKNANVGLYIGKITGYASAVDMPTRKEWSGTFQLIEGQSTTQAGLRQSDGYLIHAYDGANAQIIADWNGNSVADPGTNWCIKKVTEIPVTISSVGYASLALPFAVSVPEGSGVKAYIATTIEPTCLKLQELRGNVIPANTGVILGYEGGTTVNLTITTDEAANTEGNVLHAATAKRAGFEADATYVLARNSAGEAAFLQSELTIVPANKAYLLTSEIPDGTQTTAYTFRFDGTVDGIHTATKGIQTTEYYDLKGRRVLYPSRGIYVTGTGEKVLMK